MPVSSCYESSLLSDKFSASVTSVSLEVPPQHEPEVCRGHQYHCHSECFLPLYFQPAVYSPAALSHPISLYRDTWLLLGAKQFTALISSGKRGPMCQITFTGPGQISQQQQQSWHKLLTQWYTYKIRYSRKCLLLWGPEGNYSSLQFCIVNRERGSFVDLWSFLFCIYTGSL